jgi:hypothetical protein
MSDRQREEASTTRELRQQQELRETEERRLLDESELPDEAKQHERRSQKAAYLKQKLAERERAEQDADES